MEQRDLLNDLIEKGFSCKIQETLLQHTEMMENSIEQIFALGLNKPETKTKIMELFINEKSKITSNNPMFDSRIMRW